MSNGKTDKWRKGTDYKKYYESCYWDELDKRKKKEKSVKKRDNKI